MKWIMSLMNRNDKKIKLHILLMYEAADTRNNNVKTFTLLSQKIMEVNNDAMCIGGEEYKIHHKGVFDLAAQDDIIGNTYIYLTILYQNTNFS